jgi:hypothetical protein
MVMAQGRTLRVGTGTTIGGFRDAPRGTSELPRPGNLHAISFYNVDTSQIMTTLWGFCKRRNRRASAAPARHASHLRAEPYSAARSPSIFRFVYCAFIM